MLRPISIVPVFLLVTIAAGRALPQAPASPQEVQRAVEKGLFFLEWQSIKWWKSRGCATCHEGQTLLLGANAAKSQGVPVDQDKLDFWTERWVIVDALAFNNKRKKLNGLGMDTAPYVFLYRDPARDESAERAAKWADVLKDAFETQKEDGRWHADVKEPHYVTPRMALALADLERSKVPFAPAFQREIAERRRRTEEWIKSHEVQRPAKTESLAGWVAYEHRRGDPVRAKQLLDELLGRKRDDGGWGIKKDDPSHLLVTAVVLLALTESGRVSDDPVVTRTQRYLLDKQSEDGRWRELGRHFHPEAYHSAYDAWTTGFAVAALSQTMPKLPPGTKRLFTPDPEFVLNIERLTKAAADGYKGRTDRTGDPTEDEKPQPKVPAKRNRRPTASGRSTQTNHARKHASEAASRAADSDLPQCS
jgi:hypothetical protein